MKKDIQRYRMKVAQTPGPDGDIRKVKSEGGDWVLFTDHLAALNARHEEWRERLEGLRETGLQSSRPVNETLDRVIAAIDGHRPPEGGSPTSKEKK